MTDPKAAISYLNGLTLRTINEIEKLLLSLPQSGSKCEIQTVKPASKEGEQTRKSAEAVAAASSLKSRNLPKPLALSPRNQSSKCSTKSSSIASLPTTISKTSSSSVSSCYSNLKRDVEYRSISSVTKNLAEEPNAQTPSFKPNYKVLTDKIRVSPIVEINGVVLDIDVEITMPDSGAKKVVKLEIECPNYTPARIKIGGKWKKIV